LNSFTDALHSLSCVSDVAVCVCVCLINLLTLLLLHADEIAVAMVTVNFQKSYNKFLRSAKINFVN